ncbi:hypothetical protein [Streptomyces sp. NPDC051219]|uniref:hypothetical protein n=1 Tax=Streptomyces sp. NPDC051219 TaxID=3155283 RepID=UPI0034258372
MSLAAEAALLEARLRMLREALDTVNSRIKAVSDTLHQLRRSASPADAADREDHGGSSGRDDAATTAGTPTGRAASTTLAPASTAAWA